MSQKKSKKHRTKRAVKKSPQTFDCSSMKDAEAKTGMGKDMILAMIKICPEIRHASNRINSALLIQTAADNPDLVKQLSDIPNIHVEKALRERNKRKLEEIELEEALKNIAPIDICRRILTRGGSLLRSKLMNIPDRTSEIYALETDSLKIRERQIQEITDALRCVSDGEVDKMIADVLKD